jgi:mono/diheme cytochrome c family protein
MSRRRVPLLVIAAGSAAILAACGSQNPNLGTGKPPVALLTAPQNIQRGAAIFSDRCAGCHNLDVAGTEGGALKVKDRERTDGPNFNVRKEDMQSVLYAIRNGGFSGAIMPENIVVGNEAQDVAAFLSKYAGHGTNVSTGPIQRAPRSKPPSQGAPGS